MFQGLPIRSNDVLVSTLDGLKIIKFEAAEIYIFGGIQVNYTLKIN